MAHRSGALATLARCMACRFASRTPRWLTSVSGEIHRGALDAVLTQLATGVRPNVRQGEGIELSRLPPARPLTPSVQGSRRLLQCVGGAPVVLIPGPREAVFRDRASNSRTTGSGSRDAGADEPLVDGHKRSSVQRSVP